MVLYKRKPITLPDPEVLPEDLNIEVWHIDETGEWFSTYERYLERFDFYSRHYFTCEITGTSCLTFFEALDSEETQFRFVEERFPLKLREPVARFLHFNGVKRLDALVERVYVRFKNDFFPGEIVYLRKGNKEISAPSSNHSTPQPDEGFFKGGHKEGTGEISQPQYQRPYIIKEKAHFNATTDSATGEIIVPAYSKYMLTEESHGSKSLIADQSQLYRDRSTFTKHLIKCFCKITLRRASSKMGAPWAVKDEYLPMYGLTMDWPPEMLKYKEDDIPNEKGRKQRSGDDMDNVEDLGIAEREDTIDPDVDESSHAKKRKVGDEIKEEHGAPDASATNTITHILEDLSLPYQGPPQVFTSFFQYNERLELIHPESNISFRPFPSIGKLLQTFQFLSSFGPTLLLSHFDLDQFMTTLRCTDPQELTGETVHVEFSTDEEQVKKIEESDWQRCWMLRSTIRSLNNPLLHYTIVKNDPADEELIDNVNNNGSGLLIEIFCALLRLFVDENGDWSVSLAEDWLLEDVVQKATENGFEDSPGSGKDEENSDSNLALEKCLDYRNVNWAERLSKRQFNNGYWLLILLGLLHECDHIPLYQRLISDFNRKVIPESISSTQLPRQLWRNFCVNLSLDDKVNIIWILVDILTNYSFDIKTAVDSSLELRGQIRSERFRVGRDLKSESLILNQLRSSLQTTLEANSQEVTELSTLRDTLAQQQSKVDNLQNDKVFLDQKLMETDILRLRPMGLDRYGNRYYWLDLSGVPPFKKDDNNDLRNDHQQYHVGRLWVQGPTKEAARFYLKISDNELDNWLELVDKVGKKEATEQVFHIKMNEDGSYVHVENDVETELVNKDGLKNYLINLTPLQRKVIDETPNCLLLSDSEWYSVEQLEDVRRLGQWLDTWGRREHDLIRQFAAFKNEIESAYGAREMFHQYDEVEQNLFFEFKNNELSNPELEPTSEQKEKSDHDSDEPGDEATLGDDDDALDTIAEEIMKLDDCSQTRKIRDKVKELEDRRDVILARKQSQENKKGPGLGLQARSEKKRLTNVRDYKLGQQARILTELINHRHFRAMEDVAKWKNDLALRYYGTSLRKNASGNTKEPIADTVEQKLKEIISQTSRTTTATAAN